MLPVRAACPAGLVGGRDRFDLLLQPVASGGPPASSDSSCAGCNGKGACPLSASLALIPVERQSERSTVQVAIPSGAALTPWSWVMCPPFASATAPTTSQSAAPVAMRDANMASPEIPSGVRTN
jgi:hypothetical protein